MLARRIAYRARSPLRLTIGWLSAAWYLFICIGLPLPMAGGKDLSRPFICMHSRCGCLNADQCYRSCCCHTAAERIAFARAHGETPPLELIALAATESLSNEAKSGGCCDRHCDKPNPRTAPPQSIDKPEYAQVVIQDSLVCRGVGQIWLLAGAALPAPEFTLELTAVSLAVVQPTSIVAETFPPAPPARPPRAV